MNRLRDCQSDFNAVGESNPFIKSVRVFAMLHVSANENGYTLSPKVLPMSSAAGTEGFVGKETAKYQRAKSRIIQRIESK